LNAQDAAGWQEPTSTVLIVPDQLFVTIEMGGVARGDRGKRESMADNETNTYVRRAV
jgi:hypothetical protein